MTGKSTDIISASEQFRKATELINNKNSDASDANNLGIKIKLKLHNGVEIPILGFGTWQVEESKKGIKAISQALEKGYIHIDTAAVYGNEKSVGIAVKEFLQKTGLERRDIFITTKLWNTEHSYEKALVAFEESLRRLEMDYVDLYLIHWPQPGQRLEAWKALEHLYKEGKTRAIGVSNYLIYHLEELLEAADIIPHVNQVEIHPYLFRRKLYDFCEKYNIILEAYSGLTRGEKLKDRILIDLAKKYRKTSAQILLRWGLQHGIVEIPKSMHKKRIIENAEIFDFNISDEDMNSLDNIKEVFYAIKDPQWRPESDYWK